MKKLSRGLCSQTEKERPSLLNKRQAPLWCPAFFQKAEALGSVHFCNTPLFSPPPGSDGTLTFSYGVGAQFNTSANLNFYGTLERSNGSTYQEDYRYSIGMSYRF